MKNAYKILVFASCFNLSGCVTEAEIEYRLSTWQGVHIDQVVGVWGVPVVSNGNSPVGAGKRVFLFKKLANKKEEFAPCVVSFVIGENEKVVSSKWLGDLKECGRSTYVNLDYKFEN
jgi:hypothetical protein